MWDLIVSVPDHCLSFYFGQRYRASVLLKTYRENRYIVGTVVRRQFVDGPSLERMLQYNRGPGTRPISVQTVKNHIRSGSFNSRKPAQTPQLFPRHRALRQQFCRRHVRAD